MFARATRRHFLQSAAAGGALLGLGNLGFLARLGPVSAADAKLDPKLVRLDANIEPLVRLLEETPRERLLEEVAGRIHKGLTYREVLAALLLAGVRNVAPRPQPGFKFHAVLVVNSAHLASLSSPDSDRWLPIFWSLDYFKSSQAANLKEGGWRMAPVNEAKVPPARKAREAFTAAMDNWDEEAADAAVASLARHAGANETFEIFCRYGARDFRSIGHKVIYVANAYRTLQCIGWQYAEPVLRSLAYAILSHEGGNPAQRDDAADRPGRRNLETIGKIRPEWQEGKPAAQATADLMDAIRTANAEQVSDEVVKQLNNGIAPQSLWDANFASASELLMRQPGIAGLHTLTMTNAFRYCYEAASNDQTRAFLLVQNAAFLPLFRENMRGRGQLPEQRIDKLEANPVAAGNEGIGEIFADVSRDKITAAKKTLGYLKEQRDPKPLIDAARVLVFLKGTDSHDYKFSSAVMEDYYHVSPEWRDRCLAAGMFQFRGSGGADNRLVQRTRAALKG